MPLVASVNDGLSIFYPDDFHRPFLILLAPEFILKGLQTHRNPTYSLLEKTTGWEYANFKQNEIEPKWRHSQKQLK